MILMIVLAAAGGIVLVTLYLLARIIEHGIWDERNTHDTQSQ